MIYRATGVGGRIPFCAINIEELQLPISSDQADQIMIDLGFRYHEINLLEAARSCVDKAIYERGVDFRLAPSTVDCSSLTKWLYALRGIWLPRLAIQQSEMGEEIPLDAEPQLGDLFFSPGRFAMSRSKKADAPQIGHVGFATGEETVIHASCWKGQVREVPIRKYKSMRHKVCLIKRIIADPAHTLTYSWPSNLVIETSDDVRWLILNQIRR